MMTKYYETCLIREQIHEHYSVLTLLRMDHLQTKNNVTDDPLHNYNNTYAYQLSEYSLTFYAQTQ